MEKSTINLKELVISNSALGELANIDLPITAAYMLSRIINKISPAMQDYQTSLEALIKKHGEEDKKTGKIAIAADSKNMPEFEKDLAELLKTEETFEFTKLAISDLGDCKVKTSILLPLSWIFTDAD